MAVVAVEFTHFDRTHQPGDVVPDDDPIVAGAPHLFVQPDPEPEPEDVEPVRIRGPLVNPDPPSPKSSRKR